MVGRQALALLVGVRILLSQPEAPGSLTGSWGFWLGEELRTSKSTTGVSHSETPKQLETGQSLELPILLSQNRALEMGLDIPLEEKLRTTLETSRAFERYILGSRGASSSDGDE